MWSPIYVAVVNMGRRGIIGTALKEKRHRAYEDFAAVGEDLVGRGVTKPSKLGIQGGSNGGLLMGNMYTYPDHWGAIVCQVPS